jgi:hypothetical protein
MSILLTGCNHTNTILEVKDIASFQVQTMEFSPAKIRLTGFAFHSSLAVSDVILKQNDDTIHIIVPLVIVRKGLSGNLDYVLSIPDSVNTVTFGNNKTVIWTRQNFGKADHD